jgi:methylmalonyl-CoA/ethylmalonyl-CoA epimerase
VIKKIDHIGIVVANLDDALRLYREAYGLEVSDIETYDEVKARVAFVPLGDMVVELVEATEPGVGMIGKFLTEKGEGFHHIALAVDDIIETMAEFKAMNIAFKDEKPRAGAHGSRVAFMEQSATQNVLTELIEKKSL